MKSCRAPSGLPARSEPPTNCPPPRSRRVGAHLDQHAGPHSHRSALTRTQTSWAGVPPSHSTYIPMCAFPAHSSTAQRPRGEPHCETQSHGARFRLPQKELKELMPDGQTVDSGVGPAHVPSAHPLTCVRGPSSSSYHRQTSESGRQIGLTKPSGTAPQVLALQLPMNVTEDACEPASGDGVVAASAVACSDSDLHPLRSATVMQSGVPTAIAHRTSVPQDVVPISTEYRDVHSERPVRAAFTRQ